LLLELLEPLELVDAGLDELEPPELLESPDPLDPPDPFELPLSDEPDELDELDESEPLLALSLLPEEPESVLADDPARLSVR
jgi:hypothetical protein